MPVSSHNQLVLLPSRKRHRLAGPHWHFDWSTVSCFDFPLIWQSGCAASLPLPSDVQLARWHVLRVGISRRLFPARRRQNHPNAPPVVTLVSDISFWFMAIIFFPPQWKLRSARQVMCELSVLCQQITEVGCRERLVAFCCWFSLSQITSTRIRSSIHPFIRLTSQQFPLAHPEVWKVFPNKSV